MARQTLSNETRNLVITCANGGVSSENIACGIGISKASVCNIKKAYRLVSEDRFDEAKAFVEKNALGDLLDWALKATGKTMSEPKCNLAVTPLVMEQAEVVAPILPSDGDLSRIRELLDKILVELEKVSVNIKACAEAWK